MSIAVSYDFTILTVLLKPMCMIILVLKNFLFYQFIMQRQVG